MVEALISHDGARRPGPSVEWLRSPARPALQVASALDRMRRAPTILSAMTTAPDVSRIIEEVLRAGVAPAQVLVPIRDAIDNGTDDVAAIAAIHALGRVPGVDAEETLVDLATDASASYVDHAIWALYGRDPAPRLIDPLARAIRDGGLAGMHAQRVLRRWATTEAAPVLGALEQTLRTSVSLPSRRHLTETIGLVPGRPARQRLERIATDISEDDTVRATAIAAFAERKDERLPASIGRLAAASDGLAHAVRMVRAQRRLARRGPRLDGRRRPGIRVAQIHLGAVVDEGMSQAGMGDTSGVATLLSRLGSALASQMRVSEVITVGRSFPGQSPRRARRRDGHRFEQVALESGEGAAFASAWPSLVAAERGIRTAMLATGVPDVIHLRMADPGSLAAARVADELEIPTVFTLAPDPHGLIDAAERKGSLDRRSFAEEDARSALWFRARLVEHLARRAREVVLFPRTRLQERIADLVGIDVSEGPPRHTVVAEGIDTRRAAIALEMVASDGTLPAVIGDLRQAVRRLPADRHGLPLVVSVGRMHEIKGMARIVEAFSTDPELSASANLVIVGGDLDSPSAAESAELARIAALFERHPGLGDSVLLLGHRSNDDVALILAAARGGSGPLIAPSGAYACGSLKEEFGLAIVEALAAGLPVVAPRAGGPATYVEDGVTGLLVDTTDPEAIALGTRLALGLSRDEATARRARALVEERFTLDRMARTLAAVYRIATGASTLGLPVSTKAAA